MSQPPVDIQAEALLLAVVECSGGDLRRAFAVLCARVSLEDVVGETFEQAIGRAVGAYFRRPALALRAPPQPDTPPGVA